MRSRQTIRILEYFYKGAKVEFGNRLNGHCTCLDLIFTLKYILDTKIGKANGLSRRPDWKVGTENNNSDQTLIKEQWICSLAEVIIEGLKVEIVEK